MICVLNNSWWWANTGIATQGQESGVMHYRIFAITGLDNGLLTAKHQTLTGHNRWTQCNLSTINFEQSNYNLNAITFHTIIWNWFTGVPSIPMAWLVWISNHMPSKEWDEITYPYPNFNGCRWSVEVWEWIRNFIPHFIMDRIIYPC